MRPPLVGDSRDPTDWLGGVLRAGGYTIDVARDREGRTRFPGSLPSNSSSWIGVRRTSTGSNVVKRLRVRGSTQPLTALTGDRH